MKSLAEINDKHSDAAHVGGTDKGTGHSYIETYEEILAPYREKATDVLELGIARGYSLLLWHDYFTNAVIHGIDLRLGGAGAAKDIPRIVMYEGDSDNIKLTDAILPDGHFDVVINDGCHKVHSQLLTTALLLTKMKPGGLLVIEDIEVAESWKLYREFDAELTVVDLSERRPKKKDNMLIILRKRGEYVG